MTSNRKKPPVPDPIVAAARHRDAMKRIGGDIEPSSPKACEPWVGRATAPVPLATSSDGMVENLPRAQGRPAVPLGSNHALGWTSAFTAKADLTLKSE